ncbi:hypothetical protein L7F22_053827 [Adiantum nelumboides]|nr:hypothetical protein [Adiantum nelumboides]
MKSITQEYQITKRTSRYNLSNLFISTYVAMSGEKITLSPLFLDETERLLTVSAMLAESANGEASDNEGEECKEEQSTEPIAGEDVAVASALEPAVLKLGEHSFKVQAGALLAHLLEAVMDGRHAEAGLLDVFLHLADAFELVSDDEEGGDGGGDGDGGGAPGEGAGEAVTLRDGDEDDALEHGVHGGDLVGFRSDSAKLILVVGFELLEGLEVGLPCVHLPIVGCALMKPYQ